jgi:hypothetical protein
MGRAVNIIRWALGCQDGTAPRAALAGSPSSASIARIATVTVSVVAVVPCHDPEWFFRQVSFGWLTRQSHPETHGDDRRQGWQEIVSVEYARETFL